MAIYLRSVLGIKARVIRHGDKDEKSVIDIMTVVDSPEEGVSTHATLGLSNTSLDLTSDGVPLRVEFLIAAGANFEAAPHILATCAFSVINSDMPATPGSIYPRVVELYLPDSDMRHCLLISPFLWDIETQKFPSKTVAWLQAVPISDTEMEFAMQNGSDVLEDIFVERQIDVFNLYRESVV